MRILFAVLLLPLCHCYYFSLDSNEESCFFERLPIGAKFTVTFEVYEGGFMDIDFWVIDPNGNSLYKGERETSGRYTFSTENAGIYTFCFGNKFSSRTPKGLLFMSEVKLPETRAYVNGVEQKNETDDEKLSSMLKELTEQLQGIMHEQDYLSVRHRVHKKSKFMTLLQNNRVCVTVNESTNFRVTMWSVFESFIMIAMTVGQVYYMKRFFEVRRLV
ncbi:Transmembrane emp24 domain-containing protein 2-like protein [Aphelenchoides besseyi]|nr:Transmembrane emp24 domain-containing protein 2-like protein [Aphelenchoides besseyi]KAI6222026.1 Transmembrane emp24 domain-containing protein 2-like protein [Aphelenchoides besseyi]